MADSTIDITRLVLCSLLLFSFAGVGLYFRSRAAEGKLPDVIKQLWTLGMIFCSGQFYFAVYGMVADTVALSWYNSIVIFMIYGSWGLTFWLFAVEYKASAISIHIRLRNCSDFCLIFLRKIFLTVATTFVLLLATSVFLDAYFSLNIQNGVTEKDSITYQGGPCTIGVFTIMNCLCTLMLFWAIGSFKQIVSVQKSVSTNNSRIMGQVAMFVLQNSLLLTTFILTLVRSDNQYVLDFAQTVGLINFLVVWVLMLFFANKLVFLGQPPCKFTCPASGGQINMLTKLKCEKQMLDYIDSKFSKEEQEKLRAYKAYEELALSYEEQLAQEKEAQEYNPLDQKFLQSLISEVANETLFNQAGQSRSAATSVYLNQLDDNHLKAVYDYQDDDDQESRQSTASLAGALYQPLNN